MPYIKIRNNARTRWKKGKILRNLFVLVQKKDLQKRKKDSVRYEQRWIVKIVFSRIKRTFDEYTYSVRLKNTPPSALYTIADTGYDAKKLYEYSKKVLGIDLICHVEQYESNSKKRLEIVCFYRSVLE